jgi:HEAT repeat protein
MESEIKQIVESFRSGDEESAFFTLIELSEDVLPTLIEIFRAEQAPGVRAFLVKVAWERRDEAVIPFLGEALRESEEEVWQQALDGLVAFASPQSLEILQSARARTFSEAADDKRLGLWLDEAIQQVEFELHAKP